MKLTIPDNRIQNLYDAIESLLDQGDFDSENLQKQEEVLKTVQKQLYPFIND
jgi:hypothetical protein